MTLPTIFNARLFLGALATTLAIGTASAETLTVAVNALPASRGNPFAAGSGTGWLSWTPIFDTLTTVNEKGELRPALAQSWKNTAPTTWQFTLKPGLTFDNGESFDANAAAWLLNYLRQDAACKAFVAANFIDTVTSAKVLDAQTVEVTTSKPDVVLPTKISAIFMVAPKAWSEKGPGDFSANPSGTGAFKVTNWGPEKVQFVARPDSWRKPKVEGMETISLPDQSARIQALQSGQVHLATELSLDSVKAIEAAGHRADVAPSSRSSALQFISSGGDTPFKDVRVRQALNYAVNRDAIVQGIYGGRVAQSSQGATPITFGYVPGLKPYAYDPAKAKQLLTEAGYAGGFAMVVETMTNAAAGDIDTLQQVALDLQKLGIRMELKPVTNADWVKKFLDTSWEGPAFGMAFNAAPTLDANRFFAFNSCVKPKAYYCDESIMPTVQQAEGEFDLEKRRALLQTALRRYHDQAHALYLVELVEITGVHRRVQGFKNVIKTLDYDAMSLAAR